MSLPDETYSSKILHALEHLWPYISGMVITMFAIMKLWWSDRRDSKVRIKNLEVIAENMADTFVTKQELHECRNDVRQVDENNLAKIYERMDQHAQQNAAEHQEILKELIAHIDKRP